jgi:uncharacterized protein YkwD
VPREGSASVPWISRGRGKEACLRHGGPLVLVLAAGIAAAIVATAPRAGMAAAQTGDCTPGSSWPASNASLATQVMALINQHRLSIGEGQLQTSAALTASAVWKARHMAEFNYFAHDDPGPPTATTPARSAADRVATCGYTSGWGENIAYGFPDAASVVTGWLGSAGHKANIENAAYVVTGVGVATSAGGAIYWVQDFGSASSDGSPPPPGTTTVGTTTTVVTTTSPTPPTTPPVGSTTTVAAPAPVSTGTPPPPSSTHKTWTIAPVRLHVVTRRLGLSTTVTASNGVAPTAAAVKCSAHVGSVRLRVVANAYRGGIARCAWRLPQLRRAHSVGRGWISVRADGLRIRRSFAVSLR